MTITATAPSPAARPALRPLSMRDLMLHLAEAERLALEDLERR